MACASSSTWKYSTEVQPFSWRIVVPLISWRAQISLPSTKIAWSGETSRSVCGMLSANAPRRMRIGATVSGRGCAVRSIRRRPIHFTGCHSAVVGHHGHSRLKRFDEHLTSAGQEPGASREADGTGSSTTVNGEEAPLVLPAWIDQPGREVKGAGVASVPV